MKTLFSEDATKHSACQIAEPIRLIFSNVRPVVSRLKYADYLLQKHGPEFIPHPA
jgi:hypothetical protein